MAGYQKKIAYLDYLENGMKIKNAGFVRTERMNGQTRLELRVKNIPEMFSGQYELKTNKEGVIGRISISRGSGSCCVVWKNGAGMPKGKRLENADGIYIRLPGRRLLQAVWDAPMELCVEEDGKGTDAPRTVCAAEVKNERGEAAQRKEADQAAEAVQGDGERREETRRAVEAVQGDGAWQGEAQRAAEAVLEDEEQRAIEAFQIGGAQQGDGAWRQIKSAGEADRSRENGKHEAEGEYRKAPEREEAREPVCYGDKWEQLLHMYGVIHPFGDDREYLSIAPKDFVVLRQEYQKMVHNSFLLHGYYNYRHLILGRVRTDEGWRYYLGVPGNFYGREKMVAEMFGFEAFEGEKEPAKAGDFGYFMKRVEI